MTETNYVAFFAVAALVTLTPGSDTVLVLRNTLRGGFRDGALTTSGICTGLFVHAVLSAVGLSVILMRSATLYQVVKFAGALYLVWLGVQSLRGAARRGGGIEVSEGRGAHAPRRRLSGGAGSFLEGFLSNVLNPKVAIFYLAFLPQFIGSRDPVLATSLLLAGLHYLQGVVWLLGLAALVARTRAFVLRSAVRRWVDGVAGTVLVGLGARLALQRQG